MWGFQLHLQSTSKSMLTKLDWVNLEGIVCALIWLTKKDIALLLCLFDVLPDLSAQRPQVYTDWFFHHALINMYVVDLAFKKSISSLSLMSEFSFLLSWCLCSPKCCLHLIELYSLCAINYLFHWWHDIHLISDSHGKSRKPV